MAKQTNKSTTTQGGGSTEKLVDVVVTQEILDLNPELVEQGGQIGETIQVPDVSEANPQSSSKPYKVAAGKSFRDKDDFSIEYNEDSDISHFSQERINHLVSIGYIEEA